MENKESAVEWLYGVFELYAKGKREAPNWWDLERAIHMENDQLLTNVIAPPYTDEMCRYLLIVAMRFINDKQRQGLCFDLYSRLKETSEVDEKIKDLKDGKLLKPNDYDEEGNWISPF